MKSIKVLLGVICIVVVSIPVVSVASFVATNHWRTIPCICGEVRQVAYAGLGVLEAKNSDIWPAGMESRALSLAPFDGD